MINIIDKKDCNGCTACVNVCPVSCISMQKDDEGFLYAKANEDICINCSLCVETCPIQSPWEEKAPLKAVAAYNLDAEMCFKSTSGGIFTLLAEQVLANQGVVFGARFTEDWNVVIDFVEEHSALSLFRGSKYVQASVGKSFANVEKFLKAGRMVLYSGTPCQIAGLNHFLGKEYDNLLTVDVACHGVPSPELWSRYVGEIQDSVFQGKPITDINFRYKYNTWRGYRLEMKNSEVTYSIPRGENPYLRPFFAGLSIREACYSCICKEGRNHADLTIADYWGAEHVEPGMENDNGLCLVIIHSKKGEQYFPYNKVKYKETDLEKAKQYNEGLHAHTLRHPKRDVFFKKINSSESIIKAIEDVFKPTKRERLSIYIGEIRYYLSRVYHRLRAINMLQLSVFCRLKNKIRNLIYTAYRRRYSGELRKRIHPMTSILCKNCLGSRISQDLGYSYNTPTIGLYMKNPDFIYFLENLHQIVTNPPKLKFRPCSKYHTIDNNSYPIGYICVNDIDIEIHFLHYSSENEAKEKWERRLKRVNLNDIVIIDFDDELTNDILIDRFHSLPYRKIYFARTVKENNKVVYVKEMNNKKFTDVYDMAHVFYSYIIRNLT